MKHFILKISVLFFLIGIVFCQASLHAQVNKAKPNIILIMADDLGYETLGCYGGKSYKTPNLDKLAEGGMRFNHCYSTPKCSTSRTTILTGRYTFRTTNKWGHIPDDEITFGNILFNAGYKTALAGKWQMALLKDDPKHVAKMGFNESWVWAWHEGPRYWQPMIYHNDIIMEGISKRYGPDVFVEKLAEFMKANKDKPFLAYYPMCLPHWPKKHEPKGPNGRYETMKEMIEIMDQKVGELVKAVDELGIRDNTLIIFTGDNGTSTNVISKINNTSIKGGKGKHTDSGTHVPLIVNWPSVIPAGKTCDDLIDFSDFLPTLTELVGGKLPNKKLDGQSFASQLYGQVGKPREWIYTEFNGHGWARTKEWKLYRDGRFYDMVHDKKEKKPIEVNEKNKIVHDQLKNVLAKLKDVK